MKQTQRIIYLVNQFYLISGTASSAIANGDYRPPATAQVVLVEEPEPITTTTITTTTTTATTISPPPEQATKEGRQRRPFSSDGGLSASVEDLPDFSLEYVSAEYADAKSGEEDEPPYSVNAVKPGKDEEKEDDTPPEKLKAIPRPVATKVKNTCLNI